MKHNAKTKLAQATLKELKRLGYANARLLTLEGPPEIPYGVATGKTSVIKSNR